MPRETSSKRSQLPYPWGKAKPSQRLRWLLKSIPKKIEKASAPGYTHLFHSITAVAVASHDLVLALEHISRHGMRSSLPPSHRVDPEHIHRAIAELNSRALNLANATPQTITRDYTALTEQLNETLRLSSQIIEKGAGKCPSPTMHDFFRSFQHRSHFRNTQALGTANPPPA